MKLDSGSGFADFRWYFPKTSFIFLRSYPTLDCNSVIEFITPWFCSKNTSQKPSSFILYRALARALANCSLTKTYSDNLSP